MNSIGPTYPAHTIVSQAEVRLVADATANANPETIISDQHRIEAAQEVEAAAAKASSVDFVT
jgi:type IV secretory pathway VirB6-like protein